jgi:hypothetical protein
MPDEQPVIRMLFVRSAEGIALERARARVPTTDFHDLSQGTSQKERAQNNRSAEAFRQDRNAISVTVRMYLVLNKLKFVKKRTTE